MSSDEGQVAATAIRAFPLIPAAVQPHTPPPIIAFLPLV